MWSLLEKISQQVSTYESFIGYVWHMLVFLFRLIVVATVASPVYSDERSAFKCSTNVVGCENVCYDEFAKISQLRFWAFQILAITTPTVFFHIYSTYVSGEIKKLESLEQKLGIVEDGEGQLTLCGHSLSERDMGKMSRRKKDIGKLRIKRIVSGNELKEVPVTVKIRVAYYVSVVLRLALEAGFMYIGFHLFDQPNRYACGGGECTTINKVIRFLWVDVPAEYRCTGPPGSQVDYVCTVHVNGGRGYVPCFPSRASEKTVFLRYMTILSAFCFLLSVLELINLSVKLIWSKVSTSTNRSNIQPTNRPDHFYFPPPPATAPTKHFDDGYYPSLAVPIKITSSEGKEKK